MGRLLVFLLGVALVVMGGVIFSEFLAAMSAGAPLGVRPGPIEFIRPAAAIAAGLLGLTLALAAAVHQRPEPPEPPAGPRSQPASDLTEPAPFPTDGVVRAFDPEPVPDEEGHPSSTS